MELVQKNYRKNHTGETFGKVKVVGYDCHKGRAAYWNIQCDCGFIWSVRYSTLLRGANQNGCDTCRQKRGNEHYAWQGVGELSQNLFRTFYHSAIARNLDFDITIEYIWDLFVKQNRRCALSGEELYFNSTFRNQCDRTASLDRIDSNKGYVKGNLQWVHRDINKLKKNMDDTLFIELCHKISQYRRK